MRKDCDRVVERVNRQAGRRFGQFRWGSIAFLGAAWLALAVVGGLNPAGATALKSTKEEPKFVPPVKANPPAGTRVNVVADRLAYDSKTKVATATGLVQITYGPYTLNATKVVYDMRKDTLEANGSIVLSEPNGNVMEADYAMITKLF
ncbi:MAG: LPS-assembly protein LptD, partial [Alphaproteobacteria bacterium]|nr:LPS-assembly protein LptD [Alphaproteobacteria bacterium]